MNRFKNHHYDGNNGCYGNDTSNKEYEYSFQDFGPPQASTLQNCENQQYSGENENAGGNMKDDFQFQHPNHENANFGWEEINNASRR